MMKLEKAGTEATYYVPPVLYEYQVQVLDVAS